MKSKKYDVVVCGAGVAGIAAAIAAARQGMKTALVEKQCLLGGLATSGLIYIYLPLCDGYGKKVIGGITEEMIRRCTEYGPFDLPVQWGGKEGGDPGVGGQRFQCCFSPAGFCMTLDKMLSEAGVDLLLDTLVINACVQDNKITSITAADCEGMFEISAEIFIDATGGAYLAQFAGCKVFRENNYLTPWFIEMSEKKKNFHISENLNVHCLGALNEKYRLTDCSSGESVTGFVRDAWALIRGYYDDFSIEQRKVNYPVHLPAMPQLRKIASIDSLYNLRDEDLTSDFSDSVGIAPDWRKPSPVWETPYRSLLPQKLDGLIAAGRCMGIQGDAWEVYRVIPTAAMTGEAAGTAAALSIADGVKPANVNVRKIQEKLRANGGIIFRSEL